MRFNEIMEWEDMGDIAFDEFKSEVFGKRIREPDTEFEEEAIDVIRQFVNTPDYNAKRDMTAIAKDLVQFKNKFPKELKPSVTKAYRGTNLPYGDFMQITDDWDGKTEWFKVPYEYTPRSEIQSWTSSRKVAEVFAAGEGMHVGYKTGITIKSEYPAIIEVNVDDSFIMNSRFMNLVSKVEHDIGENEMIRFVKTPIKGTLHIHKSWILKAEK